MTIRRLILSAVCSAATVAVIADAHFKNKQEELIAKARQEARSEALRQFLEASDVATYIHYARTPEEKRRSDKHGEVQDTLVETSAARLREVFGEEAGSLNWSGAFERNRNPSRQP